MSRSGYSEDCDDQWQMIRWRGAVTSATNGARGQAFLKDLLAAMDAMPEKRLIADELEARGEVCAIGALGKARGVDMTGVDPENTQRVARMFGVANALACEVVWMNDEMGPGIETPEARFLRMRAWVANQIKLVTP